LCAQENVLILEDNDLRNDPVGTMSKVWSFAGIGPFDVGAIEDKDVYLRWGFRIKSVF
jgi:hypothetical protein